MFTRSVTPFAGKSAVLGAALLGLCVVTTATAAPPVENKVEKSIPTNQFSLQKQTSAQHRAHRKKQHGAPKSRQTKELSAGASQSRLQPKTSPTTILSLGSFTLRAYTHPTAKQSLTRTATGTIPSPERTVAVDPRVIPFGTKIYIEGLGERIAEDSGARIKGRQLDVFLPTVEHCRHFGVQTRDVQVMVE